MFIACLCVLVPSVAIFFNYNPLNNAFVKPTRRVNLQATGSESRAKILSFRCRVPGCDTGMVLFVVFAHRSGVRTRGCARLKICCVMLSGTSAEFRDVRTAA